MVPTPVHERRREELAFTQIDRDSSEVEELKVMGVQAFRERVLPCAITGSGA